MDAGAEGRSRFSAMSSLGRQVGVFKFKARMATSSSREGVVVVVVVVV